VRVSVDGEARAPLRAIHREPVRADRPVLDALPTPDPSPGQPAESRWEVAPLGAELVNPTAGQAESSADLESRHELQPRRDNRAAAFPGTAASTGKILATDRRATVEPTWSMLSVNLDDRQDTDALIRVRCRRPYT
jgi:hypothetical protein